jgi:hypothetical protein
VLFVSGVADGVQEVVGRGDAVGAVDDRAVLADDEHGALDVIGVDARLPRNRFERAIFAGKPKALIDQQIER